MRPHRSTPSAEAAATGRPPRDAADAKAGGPAERGMTVNGRAFRRKIDCGRSTETSAERLVLRDHGNLLRGSRRPTR